MATSLGFGVDDQEKHFEIRIYADVVFERGSPPII